MFRRIILLCYALAISYQSSFAQSPKFGIIAGAQISNPKGYKPHWGFKVGAKGEYEFTQSENTAYVDLELVLSTKGWKDEINYYNTDKYIDWNTNLIYCEVPIYIGYKHSVNETTRLFASIGPYFAMGLYGSTKFEDADIKNDNEGNLFNNGTYKKFDFGLGAKIGAEINNRWQFALGYEMGLIKPTDYKWKTFNLKNRTLALSAAYMF